MFLKKKKKIPFPPVHFLAHLWGAYAIPMALSGVRRVSPVSTITTRNN